MFQNWMKSKFDAILQRVVATPSGIMWLWMSNRENISTEVTKSQASANFEYMNEPKIRDTITEW